MPELPEVETVLRALEDGLQGRTVRTVRCTWPRLIVTPSPERFAALLAGRRFDLFRRRGKYLLLGLDDGHTLIVHLRMTGALRIHTREEAAARPPDRHTHVVFHLDRGDELRFRDPRKFGRMWLVADPESVVGHLGPEPLDPRLPAEELARRLAGRRATIKALLLDQRILAGIGNIYADEALHRAGIDPRRPAGSLSVGQVAALLQAIRTVLAEAIQARGSSLRDYTPPDGPAGTYQEQHRVFRRDGQPCPVCGTPIRRTVLVQRSTYFCPTCQH